MMQLKSRQCGGKFTSEAASVRVRNKARQCGGKRASEMADISGHFNYASEAASVRVRRNACKCGEKNLPVKLQASQRSLNYASADATALLKRQPC